jgi:hypothetical protein
VADEPEPGALTPPAVALTVLMMEPPHGSRSSPVWGQPERRRLQESVLKLERNPRVRVVARRGWVQPAPAWSTHTCIRYRV